MTRTFQELGVSAKIIKALNENKFHTPFPIQEAAIPLIAKGVDVIGQAHTGTGKTAAFSLPILDKIKPAGSIQALILVPTRELAVQVTTEIHKFVRYTSIKCVSIYGGQNIGLQHDLLKRGAQIVVATPGRLIDHLKRGSIQLDDVRFVVLDEADRMLDMGFIEDIKFILFYVSEERQTCLFSATMPQEILRLAHDYMNEPEEVRLNEDELSLDTIDQSYLIVHEREKFRHLCYFIKNRDEKQTIVFAATKQRTQRLAYDLKQEGFKAITIHGDLSQKQRDIAMYRFKNGKDDILVATDIAARGIDVPAVGHVINYDIPEDPLIYFHRIGRTARAGATGKAISLVSQDRIDNFGRILRQTEQAIHKLNEEMGIEVPVHQQQYRRYSRNAFNGDYHRRSVRPVYNRSYGYNGNRYRNNASPRNNHFGGYSMRRGRFASYSQRQNYG
ncbi:DEAD/DEAH box helicase [Nitrososphaera sp. AFS]|jgi:ATP-dependent RNA helicase DeaD|uniref:DEAD/DEAH box helicase n=1 Tax=Nitrososphaera sp. AFS TaxID=2301191 RepID=UPI00139234C1|nr:DEAD/DEAH box helicase [Nitrososphaera sp. AFS]NAL77143.1 ATP-dependent helicase [Nitrososphaera sp. AFS]